MYLYTKKCLDTSKFRQTCDILLWTEVVENFIRTQFHSFFCGVSFILFVSSCLQSAFQIEIDGQILGKGVGATWEEAKLQVVS
jgi:hypothetical protein